MSVTIDGMFFPKCMMACFKTLSSLGHTMHIIHRKYDGFQSNFVLISRHAYIYCLLIGSVIRAPGLGHMTIIMCAWGTLSRALIKSSMAAKSSNLAPRNLAHSSHHVSTSLLDQFFFCKWNILQWDNGNLNIQ